MEGRLSPDDKSQFNILDAEGRLLCPACGWPGYSYAPAYTAVGGMIGMAICPCCLWEPGYDDETAASAAASATILDSIRAYRASWNRQWQGQVTLRPQAWEVRTQLANLFTLAPHVR